MSTLKTTLAQCAFAVGDFYHNEAIMGRVYQQAVAEGSDLVIFSELCVTGYPPEDLVRQPAFQKASDEVCERLAALTKGQKTAMIIGAPVLDDGKLYNAVLLLDDGRVTARQYKYDLPNYGVFDEKRVFDAGPMPKLIDFRGIKLGVMICEDLWNMQVAEAMKGCDVLLSINASPFEVGKHAKRLDRARCNIEVIERPLIYINQICGQDDLVFDGDSFVVGADGALCLRLSRTEEAIRHVEWMQGDSGNLCCEKQELHRYAGEQQVIYQAMMLGLRDYVDRNGFPGVIVGMSGGVDSALTAAVCVDALGPERARLVMMPSRFTSEESLKDARDCSGLLGVELEEVSIEPVRATFDVSLAPFFQGTPEGLAEENLQSRIRGTLLMALSNKYGHMVVATGNKSEMAVGYATLYGDMCGGYSVLKDVYKGQVYEVARWRNRHFPEGGKGPVEAVISENVLVKEPTAELRANQKDADSLPNYPLLDAILHRIIEQEMPIDDIIADGFAREVVEKVAVLLYKAEYKRRQSPPGVKISQRPFSRDRRYPITNAFRQ